MSQIERVGRKGRNGGCPGMDGDDGNAEYSFMKTYIHDDMMKMAVRGE